MDSLVALMLGALFAFVCYYANKFVKENKNKEKE